MSKENEYNRNKKSVFSECHLKRGKGVNCHHIFLRDDLHKHRIPENYPINSRQNLIPLPIKVHNQLHHIIDTVSMFRSVDTRVYLANMAYNGDIQDIPDMLYRVKPEDMI